MGVFQSSVLRGLYKIESFWIFASNFSEKLRPKLKSLSLILMEFSAFSWNHVVKAKIVRLWLPIRAADFLDVTQVLASVSAKICLWSDIRNVSYIELRIWNQVNYDHCRTSTGFEPVKARYRCDALTNSAMKPLTFGTGHLWVLMIPWRMDVKWYMRCFIYWTADLKYPGLRSSPDFFRLLYTQLLKLLS